MKRLRVTVNMAIDELLKEGFSDVLVDRCGLWVRQPDNVKKRYSSLFVDYIDRKYDENIAYLQIEAQKISEVS